MVNKGLIKIIKIEHGDFFSLKSIVFEQNNKTFYFWYNKSKNEEYFVIHDEYDVCLLKKDQILWYKSKGIKPFKAFVSNDGKVIVQCETGSQSGLVCVFDRNGKKLIRFTSDSITLGCSITNDGKYAVIGTVVPKGSVYFYDLEQKKLKWKIDPPNYYALVGNQSLKPNCLTFSKNKILVGRTEPLWDDTKPRIEQNPPRKFFIAYLLDFEGNIIKEPFDLEKEIEL